mgnify:FL=1
MESKNNKIILEISTVVEKLSLNLETLQAKVNELCKSTDCKRVKAVNKELLTKRKEKKEDKV